MKNRNWKKFSEWVKDYERGGKKSSLVKSRKR